MGATFARIKNWGATETVINSDLNAEFDNILDNFTPAGVDDYSVNTSQMRTQTDPGESGTESLATSLAGELARIRFMLSELSGKTYWYQTPATSLEQLSSAFGAGLTNNRVSSGRTASNSSQAIYLVPSGTTNTITLQATATNLVYSIAGVQYSISTNQTITGLTAAPSSNHTCTVNDANLDGSFWTKYAGENGTSITVNNMGSEISSLVGKVAAFKTGSTEYFIARVQSTTELTDCYRGYFFNSTDSLVGRVALTNSQPIQLMKLSWIYATTGGTLAVGYTNPSYQASTPTSPSIGDYWFDTANNLWKNYNGTSWASATATLVGVCIQDNSGITQGARSLDLFKNTAEQNTAELIRQSTTAVRTRHLGSRVNVFGTELRYEKDYLDWDTGTHLDSGVSLAANTYYYLYLKENGDPVISDVAPYDRRADLRGFYHPRDTWRCLGFMRTNASSATQTDVESFYTQSSDQMVGGSLTATLTNYPAALHVTVQPKVISVDTSGGAFTQTLPDARQYGNRLLSYLKTSSDLSHCLLDGLGAQTVNGATATTVATQYELLTLYSDGSNWFVWDRRIPSTRTAYTPSITGFGTTSAITGYWTRIGDEVIIDVNFQAGTLTATTAVVTLPTGLTMDANKDHNHTITLCGEWKNNIADGTATKTGVILGGGGSGNLNFSLDDRINAVAALTAQNANALMGNNALIQLEARLPVTNWDG